MSNANQAMQTFMDKQKFEALFHEWYNPLCNYALSLLGDSEEAKDIVQGVFIDCWSKKAFDQLSVAPQNYLMRAVKFKCIDFHRKQETKRKHAQESKHLGVDSADPTEIEEGPAIELKAVMQLAVSMLPEKTRKVFTLSKMDGKSYKEIAGEMGISIKTVENQMGRAFKILREQLKHLKGKEFVLLLIILHGIQ